MDSNKKDPIITKYTPQHFLIYLIFGLCFPYKWVSFLIISFSWELFERIFNTTYRQKHDKNSEFLYESWNNTLVDIIVNILGFILGSHLARKK